MYPRTSERSDQSGGSRVNAAMVSSDMPGRSPPGPAGLVETRVSEATRSGWPSATTWAIAPPMDIPTRCAFEMSSASRTPTTSSIRSSPV